MLNADYKTIQAVSHKMKSTVSVMGISEMRVILEEMENLGREEKEIEKIKTLNQSLSILGEQAFLEMQNGLQY